MAETMATEYLIEIRAEGDGAIVAEKQFKQVSVAANQCNTSLNTFSTASVRDVRGAARAMHSALMLVSTTAFPQASMAALTLSTSLRAVSEAASALKIPVGIAGAAVAGITAAIWTAVEASKVWKAEFVELGTVVDLRAANDRQYSALFGQIQSGESSGRIAPARARELMAQLEAGRDLRNNTAADATAMRAVYTQLQGINQQIYAENSLRDLRRTMTVESLDGYAKERAAIDTLYENRLAQITEVEQKLRVSLQTERELARLAAEASQRRLERTTIERAGVLSGTMLRLGSPTADRPAMQAAEDFREWRYEIEQLEKTGLFLPQTIQAFSDSACRAYKNITAEIEKAKWAQNEWNKRLVEGTELFASGLSDAIVDWASGLKDADDAFRDFARSFLSQIAKMILQQLILNAVQSGMRAVGLMPPAAVGAAGGIFPRAMSVGGTATVSSATYLPRFNVLAGEAGAEMLTVLARPRMMSFGGLEAAVGNAGPNRLAITQADRLQQFAGASGRVTIEVRPAAGYEAAIVDQAIRGARVVVVQDMTQDSDLSKATRRLMV